VLEPAVRQEELPAVEPEVLAELVEQHEPEVPVTSGPASPAAAVKAGTNAAAAGTAGAVGTTAAGTAEAAGGERAVNQMSEVIEAKVEQRVLDVVLQTLHEVLLLLAVIRGLGRGVVSELKEMITILRDRHSSLK
jgi:hypothetical protein